MKVRNVQALRAIAALMVIASHLLPMERKCVPGIDPFLRFLEPVGFTGVDLFFVISGFVIITSTWSSFERPGIGLNFILRRAARIFPVYWVVLIPIAILDLVAPSWVNGSQTVRPDILASFILLPQPGLPLLTVSWSLVYEMYFYYIYAVAIRQPVRQLPWIMGAWMAFTFIVFAVFPHTSMPYLAQLGNTITYEFAFGMIIGWWFVHKREPRGSFIAIGLGIAAITVNTIFYQTYGSLLHGQLRFLVVGLPMAAILYGFIGLELRKTFIFGGSLVLLGDASYTMYLWHVPILEVVTRLSLHRAALRIPIVHWLWLVASVSLVIVSSIILYRVIEKPLIRVFAGLLKLKSPGTILPNVAATQVDSAAR